MVRSLFQKKFRVKDELFTARVEERSPLFAIKLPEKFLRKNPDQNVAMEYNVNRLVTTRDIGMTLMDLANMSFTANPIKEKDDDKQMTREEEACILVTTRDIGMTLMDLANMSFTANPIKEKDNDKQMTREEEALAGASLLRHIHSNWRSCDDAGIPPQLCLCMDKKILQSDDYTK
ncbi:hypothetical protein OSTOST_04877 [Ostertagia ostertagi]